MTRIRLFIVLVLAIGAGGVFAFATYNYVQKIPAKTVTIPTKAVVVAAEDLEVGAEITQGDVRVIEWPASAAPSTAISDPKEVVGRGLVMPMIQNEPFLEMKLASKEAGAGLPPAIPPGLRAVSVKVNEVIGVAGYVLPGTRVDVVATVNPGQSQGDMTSKVILTNVQVLAAGTKLDRNGGEDKPMPVNVVTLLVDPEQSERLTLASTEGKIQLALRNPLDQEAPATRGVKPAMLMGLAATTPRAAARPRKPAAAVAPALPTVEIIRGDQRAQVVVQELK
ncbi:MAG: Flp pilus assembly protein CpaB [Acidobacteria bacterium]|nr:Flp pilus assembly protein CpaB [Acidobacteriota bacterium]